MTHRTQEWFDNHSVAELARICEDQSYGSPEYHEAFEDFRAMLGHRYNCETYTTRELEQTFSIDSFAAGCLCFGTRKDTGEKIVLDFWARPRAYFGERPQR